MAPSLLALLVFAAAPTEVPTASTASRCDLNGASMHVVEYFAGPPTKAGDLKCTGKKCSLEGWLYIPKGAKKAEKAVVYLHGHERDRKEPCSTAEYFLGQGWVVFAPVRRGNTGAAESGAIAFTNTGKYIDDWAGAQPGADDARKFEAYRMQYLRFQKHDVDHALRWLAAYEHDGRKLVDARKIGLVGHSYGGALAMMASDGSLEVDPAATAEIAGAELSWGTQNDPNPAWVDALVPAVEKRKVPIFFLQPTNGKSVEPVIVLSEKAARSGDKEFQAALFPPVPGAKTAQDAHNGFVGNSKQWGPPVREFFNRYFPR